METGAGLTQTSAYLSTATATHPGGSRWIPLRLVSTCIPTITSSPLPTLRYHNIHVLHTYHQNLCHQSYNYTK